MLFFFNDTATTEIYTLSLHDALPIYVAARFGGEEFSVLLPEAPIEEATAIAERIRHAVAARRFFVPTAGEPVRATVRSEEHTSELQSRQYLVCRLLLEKTTKAPTSRK